jgi:UDP-N-acetylmuramyl pentapeptide phosphotransferase/UDP-N-acetylglucosamine-1-phosphate transferase
MQFLIIAFFVSFLITYALIRFQYLHQKFSADSDLSGPQKFHTKPVPRIGGISLFIGLVIAALFIDQILKLDKSLPLLKLCICALPTFLIGLIEDLTKKVSIKVRFVFSSASAFLGLYFLNILIIKVQIPGIDSLLDITVVAIIFTVFAVVGLINAYNIIDGFNGLASMVAVISLFAIGYVALKVNDLAVAYFCLIMIGAISGFFVWNYPRGLIFLGDCGAYLIGYLVVSLSILLVARNSSVSPWFALLVNAYPFFETIFTIWRRKIHKGKSPYLPDGAHFHSLIYRRIIRWVGVRDSEVTKCYAKNASTAPFLWFLSSLAVFPAVIWWETTWVLQCFMLLFCVSYVLAYKIVVMFKTPIIFRWFEKNRWFFLIKLLFRNKK